MPTTGENKMRDDAPALYVGTYSKYNSGSIKGAWVDLEDFAGDRDGFYQRCAEIHADEVDPEFMFQDYQCLPCAFYCESNAPEELFDWLELDDDDRELLEKYADATGYDIDDIDIDAARDCFIGRYDSGADAAEQMTNEEVLGKIPDWVVIDWAATWHCNLRHDYNTTEKHGDFWVFSNR
jgi:antirestriction protein